jgi:endonuclease/exonuclease/phosphatase family metal-dependent hydrolase
VLTRVTQVALESLTMTCRFIRILQIAVLFAVSSARCADTAPDIRVMSFNVRTSTSHDGENNWSHRKELFFKTIQAFNPDLIGFQEVRPDQHDEIEARLKDYGLAGVARDDGKRKGEWSLIAFRKDRFEQVDGGTFWLSDKPEVPGSVGWDARLTRICSWVRLKDKSSGKEFLFANTHYDHIGHLARAMSSRLLMKKLPTLSGGKPIILTGDFNTTENDEPYKTIMNPTASDMAHFSDSYREVHPKRSSDEASFNGFKGTVRGSRIDFILHTPELHAISATIDRTKSAEGKFPSDHYPVTAVLRW